MDGSFSQHGGASRAAALDGSVISHRGMMLMGYQRTGHVSRKARLGWEAGDPSFMAAEVAEHRDRLFHDVTAKIAEEYAPVRDYLLALPQAPRHVIDIGCGAAINDALLRQDFPLRATLIDIEETPDQYHLWSDDGAGYASLDEARTFLLANGFTASQVTTLNPVKSPKALAKVTGDLVTSLFSCGFHYPIGDYIDLMLATINAGGTVILDLRGRYLAKPDDALTRLMQAATPTVLLEMPKSQRLAFRKAG
jgi:hypothetical protein